MAESLKDVLARHGGNKAAAARELGLAASTFKERLNKEAGFIVTGRSTLTDLRTGEAVMEWEKTSLDRQAADEAYKLSLLDWTLFT